MIPFKLSSVTSEAACWAEDPGSGGRVGLGAGGEERKGGSDLSPSLWRSCPLRMGWRP